MVLFWLMNLIPNVTGMIHGLFFPKDQLSHVHTDTAF